jgi:hypothetical protein
MLFVAGQIDLDRFWMMRKIVFLAAVSLLTTYSIASDWFYKENIDMFTDADTSFIAGKPIGSRNSSFGDPSLIIRCSDDDFELFVDWKAYIKRDELHGVMFRFDKDKPSEVTRWSSSTDGTASFAPSDMVPILIEQMKAKNTVAFGTEDYEGTPVQAMFSLSGFTAAYNQFKCNK